MSSQKPAEDAAGEIARLRAEIEALRARTEEKMAHAAREAGDTIHHEAELVAEKVRERPLAALLIAGVAGFVIGRLAR